MTDDDTSGADDTGPSPMRWLFEDRETGRLVVAQPPNPPLAIFLATVVGRWFLDDGARTALGWVGAAALGWWALDEVVRGVNPWRRILGLAGCLWVITRVVTLIG